MRFWKVFKNRNLEFLRDRAALTWNFLFPVLVIIGFAFAFNGGSQEFFKVGVLRTESGTAARTDLAFLKTRYIEFIDIDAQTPAQVDGALKKLQRHQLDMVLNPKTTEYWTNSTSPKGYLTERLLLAAEKEPQVGTSRRASWSRQVVEGKEIRYVDWLVSGLLGMNMMFSALFGVGYTIVRYRKNGVLKRLKATPLKPIEFLLAQVFSRLILIQFTAVMVYWGCHSIIHFQMLGSYAHLFLTLTVGAICLISLGLLIASRTASEELGGGLLNVMSWPMMFLSGVWFSLEGAHPWVQRVAQIFPLTHFIDAARAIMTEGAGLAQIAPNLIAMSVLSVIFLAIGSMTFKWQ